MQIVINTDVTRATLKDQPLSELKKVLELI